MKKTVVVLLMAVMVLMLATPVLYTANVQSNNGTGTHAITTETGHHSTLISKALTNSMAFVNVIMTSVAATASATGTGGTDPFANTSVANAPGTISATSTGALGKAVFYFALFAGIMCILFTKHRMFGLVVLVFGFLLGAYSGVASGLWKAVGGQ